jgi:para-nitrobenzyl esterase
MSKTVSNLSVAIAALLLAACTATGEAETAAISPPSHVAPQVTVAEGTVQGVSAEGIDAFKGLPYAAPPVGILRWRAPQPVSPWQGIYDASAFGHDCMQQPVPFDSAPLQTQLSENCLFVNVWRPTGAKKLPVMVWIHGGGFVNGGSSSMAYDGLRLSAKGVVVVSFNYRLGRFGFFGFPALSEENSAEPKGNYGYLDQLAALKWVRTNIAAFGGDPNNVTIFGESAGGGSVHTLLTSPMARGLFNKAIVESGGGRDALMGARLLNQDKPGLPSLEAIGENFAKANGINGTDAAALSALRALPADKIVSGLSMMTMSSKGPPTYGGPIVDGKVVVGTPQAVYEAGNQAKVPLIIGANSADLGFDAATTMGEALAPFGKGNEQKALSAYDPDHSGNVRSVTSGTGADKVMVEPARFTARMFAAHGMPAYEYRFSYVAPSASEEMANSPFAAFIVNKGAQHASEVPYVFDTLPVLLGPKGTSADKAMADAVSDYWVNFAKSGNPNGAGLPVWPAYNAKDDVLMNFTQDGPKAMADPWKNRLDLTEERVTQKAK